MAIAHSYTIRFTPKGIADAFDSTDTFPGACRALTNLVFDQSNPELAISRPGVTELYDFADFSNPGIVSIEVQIGGRVYGMVATSRNAGKDEPFCYDIAAAAIVAISGVTNANTPTTPAATGAWTPPTMAQSGVNIAITHPGFSGTGTDFFGVIDLTNPAAPAWTSQALTTNALTAVPTAVANLNNRFYFAVLNKLQYSDVLTLVRTNASQQLTVGDQGVLTALSGLPIQTTSAGVVGSLMVFKASQIWQVTGDTASSTLALNYLSLTKGTSSPRSLSQAPIGLYFAAVDGPNFIDQFGAVRPITNTLEGGYSDVQTPFINAAVPSRIAGGYTGSTYRVCMETTVNGITSTNDYWFDEKRRRWNGPHDFPYDCATPYGNTFILASNANPAKLIQSQVTQNTSTVFTDLGTATMGTMHTATLPKTGRMTEKQVVESTQELSASGGNVTYSITAQDQGGNTLGSVSLQIVPAGGLWGSGLLWGGGAKWTSNINVPYVYNLNWTAPLVFKKIALLIQAVASANLQIGTHYSRYADTGYVNAPNP